MESADGMLTAKNEAWDGRFLFKLASQQLIHAGCTSDDSTSLQGDPGQDVARTSRMATPGISIEQPVDDVQF